MLCVVRLFVQLRAGGWCHQWFLCFIDRDERVIGLWFVVVVRVRDVMCVLLLDLVIDELDECEDYWVCECVG